MTQIVVDQPLSYAQIEASIDLPNAWAARLDQMAALQDGWHDGEGLAPTLQALLAARTLLALLASSNAKPNRRPGIAPTDGGGLLLEWDPGDVIHLWRNATMIEIDADGTMAIDTFRSTLDPNGSWRRSAD